MPIESPPTRLWKHRHLVAEDGLTYEDLPALWFVRTPPPPSAAAAAPSLDVALTSSGHVDVTELTKRHLPDVYGMFVSGSAEPEEHRVAIALNLFGFFLGPFSMQLLEIA